MNMLVLIVAGCILASAAAFFAYFARVLAVCEICGRKVYPGSEDLTPTGLFEKRLNHQECVTARRKCDELKAILAHESLEGNFAASKVFTVICYSQEKNGGEINPLKVKEALNNLIKEAKKAKKFMGL